MWLFTCGFPFWLRLFQSQDDEIGASVINTLTAYAKTSLVTWPLMMEGGIQIKRPGPAAGAAAPKPGAIGAAAAPKMLKRPPPAAP